MFALLLAASVTWAVMIILFWEFQVHHSGCTVFLYRPIVMRNTQEFELMIKSFSRVTAIDKKQFPTPRLTTFCYGGRVLHWSRGIYQ